MQVQAKANGQKQARGGVDGDARTLRVFRDLPFYRCGDAEAQQLPGFSHNHNAGTMRREGLENSCPIRGSGCR